MLYKIMVQSPSAMKMATLSRRSKTPRSTIHHYQNLGLLPPARVVGPKLHLFGEEHLAALLEIRRLRDSGLSLREIEPRLRRLVVRTGPRASSARVVTTDLILQRATEMFVRLGYERTRIEDLARDLKMAKPTIYRHFPSKQALFLRCVQAVRLVLVPRAVRERSEKQAAAAHGDDRIRAVLENFEVYRGLTRILATLAHDPDRAISTRARLELHDMITNAEPFLKKRQLEGSIRPLDSQLLAYMLWGALMAAGDRMLLDEQHTLEEVMITYKSFVERGFLPAKPAARTSKAARKLTER